MRRDIRYRRVQRTKHIRRKKFYCSQILQVGSEYFTPVRIGKLSKGKIHCSCPLCASKTTGYFGKHWKHSDQKKIDSMLNQLDELYDCA